MRNSGTMRDDGTRPLSVSGAAGLIYATDRPSPSQVQRVAEKLQCGHLRGNRAVRGTGWTTTTGDVAEYLADRALRHQLVPGANGASVIVEQESWWAVDSQRQRSKGEVDSQLRQVYAEVFKEYFLAVIFRRRTRQASRWFRRAVLAGQIGFLLLLAVACTTSVRFFFPETSPQHAVIEQWIGQQTGQFTITQWHDAGPDPRGEGTAIHVQYRYSSPRGKAIETDRRFVIDGDGVVRVDSEW